MVLPLNTLLLMLATLHCNLTEEELALFATLHEGRVKSAHKFINTIINYIQDDDSKFVQWCSLIHPLTVAITPIMLP